MSLPSIHRGAMIDKIPKDFAYKNFLKEYDCGSNVYFWGDYGTGKSGCCSILLKKCLAKGNLGYWASCTGYVSDVMNNVHFDENTSIFDRCREVPILVLDEFILRDVAKERETMIELVIRNRVENQLTTIISSNHNPSFLKSNHPGVYSVLRGHFNIVQVAGHNFRTQV